MGALLAAALSLPPCAAHAQSLAGDAAIAWPAADNGTPDFAPGDSYAASGARPAQLVDLGAWRLWDMTFAGRSQLGDDPRTGTQYVTASVAGTAIGADTQWQDGLAGASVSLSRQTFSSGPGHGDSRDVTVTGYGRYSLLGQAYLIGALGYGWHDIATSRFVPGFPQDDLTAKYQAQDVGGRLEGGYSVALDGSDMLSPYAAMVGDAFHQPSYQEKGLPVFAAAFSAKTLGVTHMELGGRYAGLFVLDGGALSVDAVAAWAYELDDNPYVLAAFQTAPDTKFPVYGTRPAKDTALIGAGLRYQAGAAISLGLRSDARLGPGTTIYSGTADITCRW